MTLFEPNIIFPFIKWNWYDSRSSWIIEHVELKINTCLDYFTLRKVERPLNDAHFFSFLTGEQLLRQLRSDLSCLSTDSLCLRFEQFPCLLHGNKFAITVWNVATSKCFVIIKRLLDQGVPANGDFRGGGETICKRKRERESICSLPFHHLVTVSLTSDTLLGNLLFLIFTQRIWRIN